MIKSFLFENFKSFEKAELNLEAVTSLIGANSAGKSNAIEGIQILAELATGLELNVVLDGTRNNDSHVRGGSKACSRFKTSAFKLGCLIDWDEEYDLLYSVKIGTAKRIYIEEESLYKVKNGKTNAAGADKIFKTKCASGESGDIKVEYRNGKPGMNPDVVCMRTSSILAQLKTKLPMDNKADEENQKYIQCVLDDLKGIFVFNPIPTEMRDYVRLTDVELKTSCENISPVLKELCQKKEIRDKFLLIVRDLPENEVVDIEFIETRLGDVIFGLKEKYMNTSEVVDAKKLSDGTLKCIAIVAAVLSVPENSVLIVEEIDNGIHPGRIMKLINSLEKIGKERCIDLILTTHNPYLLNRYSKEQIMGVSVVYREKEKGTSRFIPFVDMAQAAEILAKGGIGDAMIDASLQKALRGEKKPVDYSWLGV